MISEETISKVVSDVKLKTQLMTQEGTSNVTGVPSSSLPNNPEELLSLLESVFNNKIPPIESFLKDPNIMYIKYGQQSVLDWIRARLRKK